jgi:signal transduction histidine kinase
LTEERERRRIATELHDRIGQLLVISKVKLGALREFEQSDEFTGAVNEICDSLDQSIQNTRSLTFDLSSPILYELGFEAAVAEWLDEQIREKHGIETEFIDDGQPKPLDDDISVLLFRDVRELLINVVKHAQADKVKVAIRRIDNEIYVSVEDDGVGFNISEITSIATKTRGFGLFSIRERLEQLGGRLEIDSKPGCGTRVTVIAPLKQGNVDDNKR